MIFIANSSSLIFDEHEIMVMIKLAKEWNGMLCSALNEFAFSLRVRPYTKTWIKKYFFYTYKHFLISFEATFCNELTSQKV